MYQRDASQRRYRCSSVLLLMIGGGRLALIFYGACKPVFKARDWLIYVTTDRGYNLSSIRVSKAPGREAWMKE